MITGLKNLWNQGNQEDPDFVIEFTVTAGKIITLPTASGTYNCTIDWGDGTTIDTLTVWNGAERTHTYVSAGTYQMRIAGTFSKFIVNNGAIKTSISKIVNFGETGMIAMDFRGCTLLTTLPSESYLPSTLTSGQHLFLSCTGLVGDIIPTLFFSKCTGLLSLYHTFSATNITVIPSGLLDGLTSVTNCLNVFSGTNITNIPSGLFNDLISCTSHNATFSSCSLLPLSGIPNDLFDSHSAICTSYYSVFATCLLITSVPTGLFSTNQHIPTAFSYVWKDCPITSIPNNYLDGFTNLTDVRGLFQNTDIAAIPTDLLRYNTKLTMTGDLFYQCNGLVGDVIPANLFQYNPLINNTTSMFRDTNVTVLPNLSYIAGSLSISSYMFYKANIQAIPIGYLDGLATLTTAIYFFSYNNIASLPANLLDDCTSLSNASQMFSFNNISSIPSNFLNNNTSLTNVGYMFSNNLISILPINLFDSLINVTAMTGVISGNSFSSVPTDYFKFNILNTKLDYMFNGCSNLTTIPTDLFRYMPLVNDVDYLFYNCIVLNAIPTDTFRYNTAIKTWTYAFGYTYLLTSLPTDIFKYNIASTHFTACFRESGIVSFPTDIFRYTTLVTYFNDMSVGSVALTTLASNMFDYIASSTPHFGNSFAGCSGITSSLPELWVSNPSSAHTNCFDSCFNASNYADALANGWT